MEALDYSDQFKTNEEYFIPKSLIYEMSKGQAIYYKGYKNILKDNKAKGDFMGSSYLQAIVIMAVIKHLLLNLPDTYQILTNEIGVIHEKGNWRALDIAIYKKEALKGIPLENKYLSIPPETAIEIDTKADIDKFGSAMDYVYEKTDDLLDFGIKKVIWIFTNSKKIMTASPDQKWTITGWNESFTVIEGININIQNLVKQETNNV